MKVAKSAQTAVMRWPLTNSAVSNQCEPMSATARERPAHGSIRQL
jgi:hypothetical protein